MHEYADAPGLLVIDDEPAILDLLRMVGTDAGLRVWTARRGDEGVELHRRHRGAISLVLCDVRMPGLDGPATVAWLRQSAPDVRFCFMTGGSGGHTAESLISLGALRLFDKPFDMANLGRHLYEMAVAGRAAAA